MMTICAETAGRSWKTCTRGIQGCICGMDNRWRVAHVLEQHSKFRHGEIDMDQSPSPQVVGLAIDAAVKMLLEQAQVRGTTITRSDAWESHVIWAAKAYYTEQLCQQLTATRTALAAAEAREEKLRGSLVVCAPWLHAAYDRPPQTPEAISMLSNVDNALSIQHDDSALREMIAGVYEECAKYFDGRADWEMFGDRVADDIRALAEKAKVE